MDLDGLAEGGDLDDGDAVTDEADEADGLGDVAVDPLFVAGSVGVAALLLADLALGCAQGGEDHAVVHADEDVVGGDGVLQLGWEGVGVGLVGGLDAEVDDGIEESLDLGGGDLGDGSA